MYCKTQMVNNVQGVEKMVLACGTHIKGTPHGIVDSNGESKTVTKIEVWVQEIKGINYYIDDSNNVYLPEDILQNSTSPRKIGVWSLTESGDYQIPALGVFNMFYT